MVRLAIRTSGDLDTLAAAVAQTAQSIDRQIRLSNVVPFREIVDRTLVIERLVASVSTAFGVLALTIAGVGLYGVLAYGVTRRRREIGVRIAIGASPGAVEWMILRESLALFAAGIVIGVPAAILVNRQLVVDVVRPEPPGSRNRGGRARDAWRSRPSPRPIFLPAAPRRLIRCSRCARSEQWLKP